MALINCPECSTQVSEKAVSCPSCGCPIAGQAVNAAYNAPAASVFQVVSVAKSRGVHIILGLLFGGMGFHNFYSGHNSKGGIKVGLFMVGLLLDASTNFRTGFVLIAAVINALWALGEIIFVTTDANARKMI